MYGIDYWDIHPLAKPDLRYLLMNPIGALRMAALEATADFAALSGQKPSLLQPYQLPNTRLYRMLKKVTPGQQVALFFAKSGEIDGKTHLILIHIAHVVGPSQVDAELLVAESRQ